MASLLLIALFALIESDFILTKKTSDEKRCGFNSFDCVDVYMDEPGDKTVRPIPPQELARARDLRDRLKATIAAEIDLSDSGVFVDEPGENTVRPCEPRMLAHAQAERAKILAGLAHREAARRTQANPAKPN